MAAGAGEDDKTGRARGPPPSATLSPPGPKGSLCSQGRIKSEASSHCAVVQLCAALSVWLHRFADAETVTVNLTVATTRK